MDPVFYLVFALFPVAFVALWVLVLFIIARASGWSTLADWYRGDPPSDAETRGAHWMVMGRNWFRPSYRNIISLAASPAGLGIRPFVLFRLFQPALFIPRADMQTAIARKFFFTVYEIRFTRAVEISALLPLKIGEWLESKGAVPLAKRDA